ncbi:MAG: hypothetical protein JWM87_3251 [Candidatus Eremiobacteraeota bacterium]|nr:hypothetical protein [Candidatus Eremiobacteraeota bacterium]
MKRLLVFGLALGAVVCSMRAASATPAFAARTGISCDACHNSMRNVNDLGETFARNGYRLPNLGDRGRPVVGVRGQFAYTSEPDPSGMPKVVLDEVEVFVSGRVNREVSYFVQPYLVDGGAPGSMREAWVQYTTNGSLRGAPVRFTAGAITLPLPVDPETFRQTNQHYAIFDQTVGANPFNLIDPHNAVSLGVGNEVRGTSLTTALVQGHDQHSGLANAGTDRMVYLQHAMGGLTFAAYSYDGKRDAGTVRDEFHRHALAMNAYRGRWALETLLQTGYDSSPNGDGEGIASSGGYAQLRYRFDSATFGIVRYDGVADTSGSFERSLTVGATRRIGKGLRLGAEDVIRHGERTTHEFHATLGFGVTNSKVGSSAY